MPRFLEIASYVVLPLAWGLGVEFLFEWARRRRARAGPEDREGP